MNLTFLVSVFATSSADSSLWDKIESFFDGFTSFFTSIGNAIVSAIEFLIDTVESLLEAVEYMVDSVAYISSVTTALPALISTVFVAMLSLCIVFAIAGR